MFSAVMAKRRREAGGGSWWRGGAGEEGVPACGGGFTFGENALGGVEMEADDDDPQAEEEVDADIFQLSYPRPRLRWTTELHDQFVKAVDQLGGANKATPKGILNLMRVQGITLYHLKSHLQKFRLGKMGRKLWRREFVPSNYSYRRQRGGSGRVPPMNLQAQRRPSISNVFNDVNNRINNTVGAETYGNMHLLVEKPQSGWEKFEFPAKFAGLNISNGASSSTSGVKIEQEFGGSGSEPALLPLFPPIPACGKNYSPEWSEFLQFGGRRSVAPPPPPRPVIEIASVDDYLNSLGYSSSLTQSHHGYSCSASMIFGSFFDEVASFSKVDDYGISDHHLTSDANLLPMEAPHHDLYYHP
ncbi:hypothetical protein C2S51_037850 [Perilla frutescens var. frutescens]|nr:hypothetical protein C2S51_037850 [Perilla frutescens var. frutescens]